MSKSHIRLSIDISPAPYRPKRLWMAPTIVAGVLIGPLAVEGALCCYAQWCEVAGNKTEVNTPFTDAVVDGCYNVREWLDEQFGPGIRHALREPKIALPMSTILVVVAIALLRR